MYGSGRSQVLLLRCCCRRRALQLRSISKALVTWKPHEATQERATHSEEAGPHVGAHFLLPHQIGTIEALRPHLSTHLSWLVAQNWISTKRMANFFRVTWLNIGPVEDVWFHNKKLVTCARSHTGSSKYYRNWDI
jgi:hypothetical protein